MTFWWDRKGTRRPTGPSDQPCIGGTGGDLPVGTLFVRISASPSMEPGCPNALVGSGQPALLFLVHPDPVMHPPDRWVLAGPQGFSLSGDEGAALPVSERFPGIDTIEVLVSGISS